MDKVMRRAVGPDRSGGPGAAGAAGRDGAAAGVRRGAAGAGVHGVTRPPGRRDPRRPGGAGRVGAAPRPGAAPGAPYRAVRVGGTAAGAARPAAPEVTRTSENAAVGPSVAPRPTDVFADRLLAVLSGQRPVHWMLRHTAGRAYDELAWLAERSPLSPAAPRGPRPVVRDVGYFVPRAGAVEAFARIGAGDRLCALAFRLERGADRRWRCTTVELGGPGLRRPAEQD
jgi:Family of unknown function (DUF6459)